MEKRRAKVLSGPKTLNFDVDVAKFTEKQLQACYVLDSGKIKFLLYGGAMGPGKSYFLRWFAIRYLMTLFGKRDIKNAVVMLACEDYPTLKDRQLVKIAREFPTWLGKSYTDHKDFGRCFILDGSLGNGVICFRNLDDPSKYMSAEFAAILIDELTKNDYDTFLALKTRLRWPGLKDIECLFVGASNPGGIGHSFCRALWIDRVYPPEFIKPFDYRSQFAYIPARAEDNPHLDDSYYQSLNMLPLHLRSAYRDGSWDVFAGQAFQEWSRNYHVIEPVPVPPEAPLFMTFDWGFGAPFSVGWWWVDSDGRLYRFAEWYGWNGTPNQGMRLADPEIAEGIIKHEEIMGYTTAEGKVINPQITRFCDPTCFNKKPDYRGGGQGPSTAEIFRDNGLILMPGDSSRKLKWRQFHQRLMVPRNDNEEVVGIPMVQIYNTCAHFIRTVPSLVAAPNNIEDVDCFTAGTLISTPDGDVPIERLKVNDFVNTPIGPRRVLLVEMVGRDKTISVSLSNGTIIEATEDHKIYVKNTGLLPLIHVSSGRVLMSEEESCLQKLWSTEEQSFQEETEDVILSAIHAIQQKLGLPCSIGPYGFIQEEQYLWDSVFTTSTMIRQIMLLTTWNLLLRRVMQDYTMKKELKTVTLSKEHVELGESQMKQENFLRNMARSCIQTLPSENLRALIVANLLQRDIRHKNTAPMGARMHIMTKDTNQKPVLYAENNSQLNDTVIKKSELVVTGVVGNFVKKRVYNLSVEQSHLFYANGILSSNSSGEDHGVDEAALIFMARPLNVGGWNLRQDKREIRRAPTIEDVARIDREMAWQEAMEDVIYV